MTKQGYIRPACEADIPIIAPFMRPADVAEIEASSGDSPEEALRKGLSNSDRAMTICLPNGLPVGMYGVVPTDTPRVGGIWMLASENIYPIQTQLLRESKQRITEVCQGYDLVFNFTDARNTVHHRWIKWAGFTIIKRHEIAGVERRPFLEFCLIVENLNV